MVRILYARIVPKAYETMLEMQISVFDRMGRTRYILLPKQGTNPRGIEFSKEAMTGLINHTESRKLMISWVKPDVSYSPYQRWIDYWRDE